MGVAWYSFVNAFMPGVTFPADLKHTPGMSNCRKLMIYTMVFKGEALLYYIPGYCLALLTTQGVIMEGKGHLKEQIRIS